MPKDNTVILSVTDSARAMLIRENIDALATLVPTSQKWTLEGANKVAENKLALMTRQLKLDESERRFAWYLLMQAFMPMPNPDTAAIEITAPPSFAKAS